MLEAFIALIALTLMEIVLGIDNIVFISVATGKLQASQQSAGRRIGLLVALGTRLLLLIGIFWVAQLITPLFTLTSVFPPAEHLKVYFYVDEEHDGEHHLGFFGDDLSSTEDAESKPEGEFDEKAWEEFNEVTIRDLIMLAGGLFLIYSSVREIHHEVEVIDEGGDKHREKRKGADFAGVITRVAIMDIVFSLDSVITAVGMANQLWVMITAVIIAVLVMIIFANQVGDFVDQHPTVKMLALAFLLLIGVMLVAEGIGTPISKAYIYFAMGFSLIVEYFNMRARKKRESEAPAPAGANA